MQKALVFLIVSTVLLAACSPAAPEADAPQDGSNPSLVDVLDDAGVEIDPVLREIMELEEKRAGATYMVAYTNTMSNNGETLNSQMTEYQQGAAKKRTDMNLEGLGESRTYVLGDDYISCSKFTGSWRCTKSSASDDVAVDESDDTGYEAPDTTWDEEEVQEATFEKDGTMQIAGVTATCYIADYGGLAGRQCYSDEGVTLYMRSTDAEGGVMEMRATSYRTTVAASDFTPPATPVDANSPEAQDASCRDACVFMEISGAECDEFCAMQSQYGSTVPEGTEGDWSDTEWE